MIAIGGTMIYLAIAKHYEPLLLHRNRVFLHRRQCARAARRTWRATHLALLYVVKEGGLFHYAYEGCRKLIIPPLIFLGVGAMTIRSP